MKVLVTGGNGFLGRFIINELVERGVDVVSLDIVHPPECIDGVEYAVETIMDKYALSNCMKGCDGVFHLAAILGVKRADKYILKCLNININGTRNVLEACLMSNVPYIWLASSSEVYGDADSEKKYNEDSQLNPKSAYAISKLAAEEYVKGFNKKYGLEFNIGRFFNIYGPGQVAEFVVPRFIKMVEKGIPPSIYGDGEQIRSFCYTKDSSRAAVDIFMNGKLRGETFNIGNDQESITMKDLCYKIISIMGSNLEPLFIPFSESDRNIEREIYRRIPNTEKIKQAMGFQPRYRLDEGLNELISSGDIPDSWIDPIVANRK